MLKNNNFVKRSISSVFIVLFLAISIYIVSSLSQFGMKTGEIGRIIGLVCILLFGIVIFYEAVIAIVGKNIWFLFFGILSILVIYGLDYRFILKVVDNPINSLQKGKYHDLFSWYTFVVPFIGIVPILFLQQDNNDVVLHNILFVILFIILTVLFTKIVFIFSASGWQYITFLILSTILFDTTAYLGGMKFGRKFIKKPFAPKLSPKKSWEGFLIGYAISFIFIMVFGHYLKIFKHSNIPTWLLLFICALVLPIACQVGDLFFSSVKRTKNIKDFSNIIPGHGGILDRIDGLIFIVIVFGVIFGISLL